LDVVTSTDLAVNGPLMPIVLVRTYRTLTTNPGPLGIGTGHNYAYELDTSAYVKAGGPIGFILPNGSRFDFSMQPDGSLANSTTPFLIAARMTNPSLGIYNLAWPNGWVFQFQSLGQNLSGYLTSISDTNHNTITIARNAGNPSLITQVTDPGGAGLTFTYDSSSRIVAITSTLGQIVTYA